MQPGKTFFDTCMVTYYITSCLNFNILWSEKSVAATDCFDLLFNGVILLKKKNKN